MAAQQGVDSDAVPATTETPDTPVEGTVLHPQDHPLRGIAASFVTVRAALDASSGSELSLTLFVAACERINILFSLLGVAFAFAGTDFVAKVKDLKSACAEFPTAEAMLDKDMAGNSVKVRGSHSRNLLRVARGLDLNRRLFQYMLQNSTETLRAMAGRAYEEVFSKHHSWAIRSFVTAGLLALPSTHQFLVQLQEDEQSSREPAETFVVNVEPVLRHIDALFISRGLGVDW